MESNEPRWKPVYDAVMQELGAGLNKHQAKYLRTMFHSAQKIIDKKNMKRSAQLQNRVGGWGSFH